MKIEQGKIVYHESFQGDYRRLDMSCPQIGTRVQAGQFVHIKIPDRGEALLRRPFSVFRADADGLSILYKPVGRGTETLASLQPGRTVDLLGPLGHGFPMPAKETCPVLVAGGYGMAALYLCAERFPRPGLAFFGGASAEDILCVSDFEKLGWKVYVATEDGSRGEQGLVTNPLLRHLKQELGTREPEFYACGPNGMLKAIGELAGQNGWRSWLSIDRNMGCGVGACLACVQKIRQPDGNWTWLRVCREGPVFDGATVVWDEDNTAHTRGASQHA